MAETENPDNVTALTVQLLSAYLTNNTVASQDLAELIRATRTALTQDTTAAAPVEEPETYTPAVSVRKSLSSPEYLISLIDGKRYKTLKRHLTSHGLTPEAYRERYGLPASYPMVAPEFAEMRREIAGRIGLGRPRQAQAGTVPASTQRTVKSPDDGVNANDSAKGTAAKSGSPADPVFAKKKGEVVAKSTTSSKAPAVEASDAMPPRRKPDALVEEKKSAKPRTAKSSADSSVSSAETAVSGVAGAAKAAAASAGPTAQAEGAKPAPAKNKAAATRKSIRMSKTAAAKVPVAAPKVSAQPDALTAEKKGAKSRNVKPAADGAELYAETAAPVVPAHSKTSAASGEANLKKATAKRPLRGAAKSAEARTGPAASAEAPTPVPDVAKNAPAKTAPKRRGKLGLFAKGQGADEVASAETTVSAEVADPAPEPVKRIRPAKVTKPKRMARSPKSAETGAS